MTRPEPTRRPELARTLLISTTSLAVVAVAIPDGVEAEVENIFPGPNSQDGGQAWRADLVAVNGGWDQRSRIAW